MTKEGSLSASTAFLGFEGDRFLLGDGDFFCYFDFERDAAGFFNCFTGIFLVLDLDLLVERFFLAGIAFFFAFFGLVAFFSGSNVLWLFNFN